MIEGSDTVCLRRPRLKEVILFGLNEIVAKVIMQPSAY